MYRILHVTADYPDHFSKQYKTKAIPRLIRGSSTFDHLVVSINRTGIPSQEVYSRKDDIYAFNYFAFPFGFFLRYFLSRFAKKLLNKIKRDNLVFDIIHAHKLTFEGIISYYLSQRLRKPFIVSLRGDTDLKLIKYKLNYRSTYRKILDCSEHCFVIAPWAMSKLKSLMQYNLAVGKYSLLPNIIDLDLNTPLGVPMFTKKLVTVLNLDAYKRKNILKLIRASDRCMDKDNSVQLDIIGDGSKKAKKAISSMIGSTKHADRFKLLGYIENSALRTKLKKYSGLVLPSLRETFGMVLVEAIGAGVPILYSKDTSIDGYLNNYQVGVTINPCSVSDIQDGIKNLIENQMFFKENIRRLKKQKKLDIFLKKNVVLHYEKKITEIMEHQIVMHPEIRSSS